VKIPGNSEEPAFQVEAILDPVSSEAQKLAPILLVSNNTLRNLLVFVLNLVFSLGKQ